MLASAEVSLATCCLTRASATIQRAICPGASDAMSVNRPRTTSTSPCPELGPLPPPGAAGTPAPGCAGTGRTPWTLPVGGTPAEHAPASSAASSNPAARGPRPLRSATDDLCGGRPRSGPQPLAGVAVGHRRLRLGDGQDHRERRALADRAGHVDGPAVQVDVLQRDRQPQPGAAEGAGPVRVGAVEPLEDVGHVLGGNALPLVLDP